MVDLLEFRVGFLCKQREVCFGTIYNNPFLGHILDSVKFKVFLPDEKIGKIITYCDTLLNNKVCTIREVARLIGLFTASLHAINLSAYFLDIWLEIKFKL